MALKVKAVERKIKFNKNDEGVWRYVMQPELYIALTQAKVIVAALTAFLTAITTTSCMGYGPIVF